MKRHLVPILIFILVVPIWTISGLWADAMKSQRELQQCRIEQSQAIGSPVSVLPTLEIASPAKLIILSFFFFLLGGYFFWQYMRILSETARKVSFVSQVSHELKTPLTNIILYAGLLMEANDGNPDTLKKIEIVEQESRRLDRLVDNLLMFSSGHRLELNRQEHDVDLLVAQVVENFHQRFKEKNIRIELDCAAGKQQVDRGILEQILVNLIGNVEKYAASGGFVNIKAWIEQGRIHIRVKDGGPGIPAHMRADIFKPFFRGRNHLTEGVSGIGIGLPLAVNLAKLHGGELRLVDSQNGACFEVIL